MSDDVNGIYTLTAVVSELEAGYHDCGSHMLEVNLSFHWRNDMLKFVADIKEQAEALLVNNSEGPIAALRAKILDQ